jgi:hypothetical protein
MIRSEVIQIHLVRSQKGREKLDVALRSLRHSSDDLLHHLGSEGMRHAHVTENQHISFQGRL